MKNSNLMPSKSAKGPAFYAVHKGRKTGVFLTWDECLEQTNGYAGAKFKKFVNSTEAEHFVTFGNSLKALAPAFSFDVAEGNKGKKRALSLDVEDEVGWDVVYSDGACKGNGKVGSVAGVGVWWGHNDPRNIAERCPGDQTNNRAELIAIARVLESTPRSKKPLLIKTDSQYSINCFQNWISNWSRNGWVNSSKEPVKNAGIIRYISALLDLRAKSGQKVRLQYVKGHSGDTGNDGADAQANQGTTQPPRDELDWAAMEKELRRKIELEWHAQKVEDAVPVEVVSLEDNATTNKVLPSLRRRAVSPRRAETPSPQKKQANSRRILELEATLESPVQSRPSSSHAPQAIARLSPSKTPLRPSTVAPPVPVNEEDFDLDRGTMSLHADETSSPKRKEASMRRYLQMEAALKPFLHSRSLSSHPPLAAQIKRDDAATMPPSVAPLKASSVISPPAPVKKGGIDPDRRTISPRPVEISSSQKKSSSLYRILEMEAAFKPSVQSRPLSSHAPEATQDDTTKLPPSMTTVKSPSVVSAPVSVDKEDLDLDMYVDCLLDDDDLANDFSESD